MAHECFIVVISIELMNWSTVCWYQLYLNIIPIIHQRSDSIGQGVTSFRKYSLKTASHGSYKWSYVNWSVHHSEQECLEGDTSPNVSSIGRPRQATLKDIAVSSYGWSAIAAQSPQVSPKEPYQQLTNVPLSQRLINNQLFQAKHCEQRPWKKKTSAGRKLTPSPT